MNRPHTMIATQSTIEVIANSRAAGGRKAATSHDDAFALTMAVNPAVMVTTTTIMVILAQNTGVTNCLAGSAIV